MNRFSTYPGSFSCHICKVEVKTLRSYYEQKLITWLCKNSHLSRVSLETKKRKSDYERKG
jgi:hypothetical protein